jgi:hypothetical protein
MILLLPCASDDHLNYSMRFTNTRFAKGWEIEREIERERERERVLYLEIKNHKLLRGPAAEAVAFS